MSGKTLEEKQKAERIRWIEEPITWARKFGGKDFDPWSGQERFWIEYGKLLNAKIKRWKRLPLSSEEQAYARKIGISIMAGQGVGNGCGAVATGYHYIAALERSDAAGTTTWYGDGTVPTYFQSALFARIFY